VLTSVDADRATVLEAITKTAVVHFACHGLAVFDDPLDSGLLLAGTDRLTLRDLLDLSITADLAVVSACETALTGTDLPDEAQNLSAALLQGLGEIPCQVGAFGQLPRSPPMPQPAGMHQHCLTPQPDGSLKYLGADRGTTAGRITRPARPPVTPVGALPRRRPRHGSGRARR
jgi:hypothetical protein